MWALRRASIPLKLRCLTSGYRYINGFQSEMVLTRLQLNPIVTEAEFTSYSLRYAAVTTGSFDEMEMFSVKGCSFSSQAGGERGEAEEDLEDGFSEHEASQTANWDADERILADGNEEEVVSENEIEEDSNDDFEEKSENMLGKDGEVLRKKMALFNAIVENPKVSVDKILNDWVEEGKPLERVDVSVAITNLRKRKLYSRALQILRWLEDKNQFDFTENDYASRLDLICKLRGLQQAENYIEKIPKSFRGEVLYRTLLANCVVTKNLKKAEEVFEKMKELEFPVTTFACNQLLLLYKRYKKNKIADILLLMERENVKPSLLTYKILINTKGQSNDIQGMDQVIESMKTEGVEPDITLKAILSKHYLSNGLKDKALAIMKEMEGGNLNKNHWVCSFLLPLYAEIGAANEVERIWKVCESNPRIIDCEAAIQAWGKLKKIDQAEAVFEKMLSMWKDLRPKYYCALLKVYTDHKMLAKGKDLVKRIVDRGFKIDQRAWNAIVKLYVAAGEVEKADAMLQKAVQQKQTSPLFASYITIMEQYAKKGDVHNAEKILLQLKQAGYRPRIRQFQTLVQAYINAKAPAYGIRERMKADNIFPTKALAAQLAKVDAFRRTAITDLLE